MNLKKSLMLSLIILLSTTWCSSQNILKNSKGDTLITITPSELKTVNLIFVEHKHLLKENVLLQDKITQLEAINLNLTSISSLKDNKLDEFDKKIKSQLKTESDLNKQIEKLKKGKKFDFIIGGALIATITGLIVFK